MCRCVCRCRCTTFTTCAADQRWKKEGWYDVYYALLKLHLVSQFKLVNATVKAKLITQPRIATDGAAAMMIPHCIFLYEKWGLGCEVEAKKSRMLLLVAFGLGCELAHPAANVTALP